MVILVVVEREAVGVVAEMAVVIDQFMWLLLSLAPAAITRNVNVISIMDQDVDTRALKLCQ